MDEPLPAEPWTIDLFKAKAQNLRGICHWHSQLQQAFPLHPTVAAMLNTHMPHNWTTVLLQWPHVSETDTTRLAYNRATESKSATQTVTSIGKYLARHWPHVSDHTRRDAAMLYTPDLMSFVHTIPEMIYAVNEGPRSCMATNAGCHEFSSSMHRQLLAWMKDKAKPEPDWELHPYSCYDPKYGWHMAVRYASGRLDGRAVCLNFNGGMYYVRTYMRHMDNPESGYSHSDHLLGPWLDAQGYECLDSWPTGAKLASWESDDKGMAAPYLDGDNQRCTRFGNNVLVIAENGEYSCDNTHGFTDAPDDDDNETEYCEDCESHVDSDDMCWVGRNEENRVCCHCRDNHYSRVRGYSNVNSRGWCTYYVHEDNASSVEGQDYCVDENNVPGCTVFVDSVDCFYDREDCVLLLNEWFVRTDEDVVETSTEDDDGEYLWLRSASWQDADGDWHRDSIDYVLVEGQKYLAEDAPEGEKPDAVEIVRDTATNDMFALAA